MPSLLDTVIERTPLTAHAGVSGSSLERLLLADGTRLVVKRMRPQGTWLMRVTGDPGVRDAYVWTSGLLARVPSVIDHAVIGAEPDGEDWLIIMRDVGDTLIPAGTTVSRADSRRILQAAAALHATFRGETAAGLCTLTDRYRFLSPAGAGVEWPARSPLRQTLLRGWELFPEVAPADVSDAVFAILAAPHLLAGELLRHETTLIHGDLHLANVGLAPDRVVLLDWGLLTAIAPAAVEFAYYLDMCSYHARIDASADALIEDFRASDPEHFDMRALRLSLLGTLVMMGAFKALACVDQPEDAGRALARANLNVWLVRAREALDEWSPI